MSSLAGTAKAANTSSNGFIPLTQSRTLMNSSVQHHPSLAGPQAQTIASTATLGHTQMRSNARLIQLPNHPLASGSSLGHPSNTGSNTQSASVTGKQAQEASSTALSTTKSNWITKHTLPPSLFIQQVRAFYSSVFLVVSRENIYFLYYKARNIDVNKFVVISTKD